MLYFDWFLHTFMKEILPIMLVFTHTSINNGMFSQLAYDRSFISQKYEECRFLIDEMSMFNIHENEKNSVSWPIVSNHKQDRPWRVSGDACMVFYIATLYSRWRYQIFRQRSTRKCK